MTDKAAPPLPTPAPLQTKTEETKPSAAHAIWFNRSLDLMFLP